MISFHNLGSSFDRGVRNFVPAHGVSKTFVPNVLEAWDHLEQLAYAFFDSDFRLIRALDEIHGFCTIASSCKELAADAAPEI